MTVDWALMLAGLGLFLLGMQYLEQSLKSLLNHSAVQLLKRGTASLWLAIPFGTGLTALMQSSSLVGLLVLAFVGAGVMPMRNALGIILGANLGTTLTGWLVALLGFTLKLDALALPLIGAGGLMVVLLERYSRWLGAGRLALGLGLLLFGLNAMKEGVASVATGVDLGFLQGLHPVWFLLFGMLLAAVIQSSSAVIMLVLSSMHAGVLPMPAALAMVIGADVGTTSTLLMASVGGASVKRQVAVFHLTYNLVTGVLAFTVLLPLAPGAFQWLGLSDSLYGVVLFHSFFNFIGIFVMLPWLGRFAGWLEVHIGASTADTPYLERVPVTVPHAALLAVQQETAVLVTRMLALLAQAYSARRTLHMPDGTPLPVPGFGYARFLDDYERLKQGEALIADYAARISGLDGEQRRQLDESVTVVRLAVYAAKAVKDVADDLEILWHADGEPARELRRTLAEQVRALIEGCEKLLREGLSSGEQEALSRDHQQAMLALQQHLYRSPHIDSISLSSLLNLARETDECGRELFRLMAHWSAVQGGQAGAGQTVA